MLYLLVYMKGNPTESSLVSWRGVRQSFPRESKANIVLGDLRFKKQTALNQASKKRERALLDTKEPKQGQARFLIAVFCDGENLAT